MWIEVREGDTDILISTVRLYISLWLKVTFSESADEMIIAGIQHTIAVMFEEDGTISAVYG